MDVLAPIPGPARTPGQDFAMTAASHRQGGPRNVEAVARGFESMFFAMLCKQMRETLEPNTLFGNDQGDVWGGLFDQFLGDHMAQSGALGIAAMVRKYLNTQQSTHEQHSPHPTPVSPAGRPAGPTLS
jgi:Rod binding domain-containing protein